MGKEKLFKKKGEKRMRENKANVGESKDVIVGPNGVKFIRDGRDASRIIDIIVPDGVDKIDASFGAGMYSTKAEASPATVITVIDIADNKRTYPGIKSITLNTVSVKAKNSQFPDVEAVSYSGALEFRAEPGLLNETFPILFSDIEYGVIGNVLGYRNARVLSFKKASQVFGCDTIVFAKGAFDGFTNIEFVKLECENVRFMPGAFDGSNIKPDDDGCIRVKLTAGEYLIADIDEEKLKDENGDVVLDVPEKNNESVMLSLTVAEKVDEIIFHSMGMALLNAQVFTGTGAYIPRIYIDRDGQPMDRGDTIPFLEGYRNVGGDCSEKDGVLFSKDGKTLIAFPHGKICDRYYIPEGTEKIEEAAFSGARVRKIVMPDSVRTLCSQAFLDCDAEEIVLSRGLVSIGAFCKDAQTISSQLSFSVFGGAKIKRLIIPASVKLIGKFAFFGCKNLSDVVFEEGGSCLIEDCAFACCPISDVSLPKSCIKVGESVFDLPKTVRMHQGTSISEHSFTAVFGYGSLSKPYGKRLLFENKDVEITNYTSIRIIDEDNGYEFFSPTVCDTFAMEEFVKRWAFSEVDEAYFSNPPLGAVETPIFRSINAIQTAKYGDEHSAKAASTYIRRCSKRVAIAMLKEQTCMPYLKEMVKENLLSDDAAKCLLEAAIEKGDTEIATEVSEHVAKKKHASQISL